MVSKKRLIEHLEFRKKDARQHKDIARARNRRLLEEYWLGKEIAYTEMLAIVTGEISLR